MPNDSVMIDLSSFRKCADDFRRAEPALAMKLRSNLKAVGELVAADARQRAGFSSRIPSRIRTRGSRSGGIRIYVLPIAGKHKGEERAYEHKGRAGQFRHPVFGNKQNWVGQQARPFLRPALEAKKAIAVAAAKNAVESALREVHSHG